MNKHKLLRLTASLRNRPHLISKTAFQEVETYLNARNAGMLDIEGSKTPENVKETPMAGDVGVITIHGPLTYRTSGWEGMCGGFSYEMLVEQAEDLLEAGAKKIVLDIDSGGGEAYGCFLAVDELRTMCDQAGAKLLCYVDGSACSAAYAIACACDEVVANPYADVGSIGVLICLYNDSKMLEKEGIQRTFVTDGSDKVPFADDGSWRDGFLEDMQKRVAELGDAFRAHVSKYTGLSTKDLKDTQARVYSAQDALSIGLVNKIMTRSEFVDYVLSKG
jgi:ClpP class serine protease